MTEARRARSVYRGIRVSLTSVPGREHVLVQVSGKGVCGHWDDYVALTPLLRLDGVEPKTLDEALHLLERAVGELRERMSQP